MHLCMLFMSGKSEPKVWFVSRLGFECELLNRVKPSLLHADIQKASLDLVLVWSQWHLHM